jgi:purine-cytosine permease-like protein
VGLLFFIGILTVIFIVLFKTIDKVPRSFISYLLKMFRAVIPMIALFLVFKYYENFLTSAAGFLIYIMGYVSIGFILLGIDFLINKKEIIYKERLKKAKEIKAIQDIVKQLEVK